MKSSEHHEEFSSQEHIYLSKIHLIRGMKVMLDQDLAELYGTETRRLNEQVRRNISRFPKDFMFRLTQKEVGELIREIPNGNWGGRRNLPFAFTEHGVLMLSSVLNTKIAIRVNIRIMRVYTKLRTLLSAHKDILRKLDLLEQKMKGTDIRLNVHEDNLHKIILTIKRLMEESEPAPVPRKKIGFRTD